MNPPLLSDADMTTTVTLHRPSGAPNIYNEMDWAPPRDVYVHWIDKQQRRVSIEGDEYVSQAELLALEPLELGDEIEKDGKRWVVSEAYEREFFGHKGIFYEGHVRGA